MRSVMIRKLLWRELHEKTGDFPSDAGWMPGCKNNGGCWVICSTPVLSMMMRIHQFGGLQKGGDEKMLEDGANILKQAAPHFHPRSEGKGQVLLQCWFSGRSLEEKEGALALRLSVCFFGYYQFLSCYCLWCPAGVRAAFCFGSAFSVSCFVAQELGLVVLLGEWPRGTCATFFFSFEPFKFRTLAGR